MAHASMAQTEEIIYQNSQTMVFSTGFRNLTSTTNFVNDAIIHGYLSDVAEEE